MTNNDLPEAPASATLSVVTPKGYNTLFTLRDTNGKDLLEKITALENTLEKLGYKPQVKGFVKKEKVFVEGKRCPKCGGRIEERISKAGKKFHKCENGRYNFMTKQNEGCDYVDWLDPKTTQPMDVRDYDDMIDPQDVNI